jgi:AcrR family transcriptional regulator
MAKRTYDASGRRATAAATRLDVIRVASRLFVERGWTGTSMRDIAREAGVSVETIYANVGNKAELLKLVLDVAVVGDDEAIPLADRPEFKALSVGSFDQRLEALGRLLGVMSPRTAPLRRVLVQASMADPEIAVVRKAGEMSERESYRLGLIAALGYEPEAIEVERLRAAVGNDAYLVLTEAGGLTDAEYATWVTETARRLLAPLQRRK